VPLGTRVKRERERERERRGRHTGLASFAL